jgi:hypothetical protein
MSTSMLLIDSIRPYFDADKYTAAGSSSINTTVEGSFECANGDTISVQYLCDGIQDCVDFSDETSCLGSGKGRHYFQIKVFKAC